MIEIPAFIFDKIWRSQKATKKYVEDVLKKKVNFSGKSVLDFGCGAGSYCFLFDSKGYLGIDLDKKRINYAKKVYPNYNFEDILLENLCLGDKKFDYVFIISTLHHINDIEMKKYRKYLYGLLKEKGSVVGMEPCFFPKKPFNNWFMKFIDRGKFIRNEKEYKSLFGNLFSFQTKKKFIRNLFYNELFYIAHKK